MYTLCLYFVLFSQLFCTTDIQTINYSPEHSLTIYNSPEKKGSGMPVFIILGNELKEDLIYAATARNLPVVAVYYNTINDVNNALRWIKENGREYNLSPDKLILCGAADGGTMAALAATAGSYVEGVTAQIELGPENAAVKAQNTEQSYQNAIAPMNPYNGKILGVIDLYGSVQLNGFAISNFITPYTPPFLMIYYSNDTTDDLHNAEAFYNILMTNLCPAGTTNCATQMVLIHEAGDGANAFSTPDIMNKIFDFIAACYIK